MSLEPDHCPLRNQSTLDERGQVSSKAPSGSTSGIGCAALIYFGNRKPKRSNLGGLV
jgi:hypothetical protein